MSFSASELNKRQCMVSIRLPVNIAIEEARNTLKAGTWNDLAELIVENNDLSDSGADLEVPSSAGPSRSLSQVGNRTVRAYAGSGVGNSDVNWMEMKWIVQTSTVIWRPS